MNPQIALLFVLIFIFIAIYIEHKRAEDISGAVWIVAIWFLYIGSKGLGFFLNTQTTLEQGSLPDRYFLIILGLIAILILIKRNFPFIPAFKQNWPVTLIIFYMLISVAWSKYPGMAFRRWGREAIALIIALLLISEKNPIQTLTSALKKAIYAALPLSIVLIKYYPVYGREYGRWTGEVMWTGIASQKNGLAMLCALSILFFIWSFLKGKEKEKQFNSSIAISIDILMIILATYLMMGPRHTPTYSSTSFLALITGIIIMLSTMIASKKGKSLKKIIVIFAIIIIFTGIFMPFSGKLPSRTLPKLLNRSETLTDRTQIWSSLIPYARKELFFGYGYGGFWTTELRTQIASHAHNGYLDTILNIGIFGMLLFLLFVFTVLVKSLNLWHQGYNLEIFFITLIFIILIRNIAEVSLGNFISFFTGPLLWWSFIIQRFDPNQNKKKVFEIEIA